MVLATIQGMALRRRLFTACLPALLLAGAAGCEDAGMNAAPIGDGLEQTSDFGAFNLRLEADTQEPHLEDFHLTIAMGDPSSPDSMGWMIPHAEVNVAVLEGTELVGELNALSSANDGRCRLDGLPPLTGDGPWVFEFEVAVGSGVRDLATFHVSR